MSEIRFNLLPHRRMSRNLAWRIFARQAAAISSVALLCSLLGMLAMLRAVSMKTDFNRELTEEIKLLSPQYEESLRLEQQYRRMVVRQGVIEDLDARRSTSVLILNDMATAVPREIYLSRMSEDGVKFIVEGRSLEAAAIARFIERLSTSGNLREITLGEIRIQEAEGSAPYHFVISGKVRLVNATQAAAFATELVR